MQYYHKAVYELMALYFHNIYTLNIIPASWYQCFILEKPFICDYLEYNTLRLLKINKQPVCFLWYCIQMCYVLGKGLGSFCSFFKSSQ